MARLSSDSSGTSDPMLLCALADGVATLTLNLPARRNALHPALIAALSRELDALRDRDDVNVVVLTANGPAFCSGLDLSHLATLSAAARTAYMRSAFTLFEQWQAMPQPTIAAINGPAVAGGFDLAAFSDLRLCVPSARFGQPEALLPKALELARLIASRPRDALFATKRLGRELPGLERDAALQRIGEALDRSLRSEAHRDALAEFLSTRHRSP